VRELRHAGKNRLSKRDMDFAPHQRVYRGSCVVRGRRSRHARQMTFTLNWQTVKYCLPLLGGSCCVMHSRVFLPSCSLQLLELYFLFHLSFVSQRKADAASLRGSALLGADALYTASKKHPSAATTKKGNG
jgi:hypothetical protein